MGDVMPRIVDDALIAQVRADRSLDPATRDQFVRTLTKHRGETLDQALTTVRAAQAEAEAELGEAQARHSKTTAKYAAALSGYFRPDAPVPGSYGMFKATPASAVTTAATAGYVIGQHARLHDALAHPAPILTGFVSWYGEWADLGRNPENEDDEPNAGYWMTRYMLYPYHVGGQRSRQDWEAKFLTSVARGLSAADTFQVTGDMCEIAEAMYEQTAKVSGHIEAADLPSEAGFLWLDKPFIRADVKGQLYGTRVVTWQPQSLRRDSEPEAGVRISLWGDWNDDPALASRQAAWAADGTLSHIPLMMLMTVVIPYGADYGARRNKDQVPEPLYYVHALWLLLGTEVAASSRERADRGTRRRLAGGPIRHDTVQVVTLRRAVHLADPDREPGHRDVDWSCRWIVRGFYRHNWGYGTVGHPHPGTHGLGGTCGTCGARVTWVRPFVKGPDGLPFKANEGTLYRLSR